MTRLSVSSTSLTLVIGVLAATALADDPSASVSPQEKPITQKDRAHWAFQPVVRPPLPAVRDSGWVRNPIDAFILSRLEENGVAHADEADRSTLLRRLCFDLTGLPPTPGMRAAFLADRSPGAYERLVECLLASPQYGERWAQHWLDLARYADSDGYEFDNVRPNAWRYRDWVVSALNRDVPYGEFIRLQIAGDEIRPNDPVAFIATGFNRCYPDMVDQNDQALRRQNALNDITETNGLVFLGLTIGCARCHDHKFDPIRLSDFYRLQAFFTPARFVDDFPILTQSERAAHEARVQFWNAEVARLQAFLINLETPVRAALAQGDPPGLNDLTVAAFRKPEGDRSATEIRLVYDALVKDRRVTPAQLANAFQGPLQTTRNEALAKLAALLKNVPPPPAQARGINEASASAPPTYVLRRGELQAKGPEVTPAVPSIFKPAVDIKEIVPPGTSTGRRQALAAWLTRADHPLTARVMVNRLWQHHFGKGLVATPNDFGTMGDSPTHPLLLDWLAVEFVERGWSLKYLHRLMVTSAAYRQASLPAPGAATIDPENLLVGHHSRGRLDGEAIRDALLAVSGRLNLVQGGPAVFPPLPDELAKLSAKGATWPVSTALEDRVRRSLYVFVRRNLRYPFFEAFDRPDTNASCPRRASTIIAPQALSLLNSRLAVDSAGDLAKRVRLETPPDLPARIRYAYIVCLSREPDEKELRIARTFLANENEQAWRSFCLAVLNVNEFIYID